MRGFCISNLYATSTLSVLDAFSSICQLYDGPPQISFSFRVKPPNKSYVMCWCLLWCFLSGFRFPFCCHVNLWQLQPLGLQHLSLLEYTLGRHMTLLVMICGPCQECIKWLLLPALSRLRLVLLITLSPQQFQQHGGAYSFGGSAESPDPPPSLHCEEGSSFPGSAPPNDKVTPNMWLGLNLMILVKWFGIRLMNLLAPCQWSVSLLDHTFILVSWVRCPHSPTLYLSQAVKIILLCTR